MDRAGQKKISCAVIGLGGFGKHYVRLLSANPRVTLAAVVNPSLDLRNIAVPKGTQHYKDAKIVFADLSIDAVIIATPLSTHRELAVAALEAGKHVLLEKPFAGNQKDAQKIESAVHKNGKVFMLAHQYLYNDDVAVLKNELVAGRIGTVRYVHAEQLYTGPIRFDVGCFREAATHEIALIDHLFSPGNPVSVQASGIDLASGNREDFAAATIRYANGLFAHIVVSSYSPLKSRRMIFGGENGMALFDDRAPNEKVVFSLRTFPKAEKLGQTQSLLIPEGKNFIPNIIERREPVAQEVEHFLDCIETGVIPRSDILHAMRVERVLEMASHAMKLS